ncbi:MAG: ABC transporter substrate-binding protein [Methanothrix sp.]|nr:ABC transporter substrate-binding protein [Methanothrix sp.]
MSRLPLLGLAAAGLLLLILCGSAPAADETVDVLTIADTTGDWGFPSPYMHYSRGPGYVRMSLIFDTLVWKNETGFVPALAESWEYLADEKAYVFHLREGVTWNDGEPFTAQDVAFTYQYIKDHPYQWVDSSVVENAEATDDRTVKITLTKDYAPFLDQVAGTLPIMPEHVYEDVSDPASFTDTTALTGTGPFKLVDYNKAQGTYLYEANENYYQGEPKVKQIRFVKVSAEMSAAALENGNVDAASVPGETVDDLKDKGFVVVKGSHDWLAKIMVNHRKAPFSDAKFRQALYYAINRQDLVDTGLRGYGLAGSPGLYASDNQWYNPDQEQYSYDPLMAGQLLEELGYEKKDGSQYYTRVSEPESIELLAAPATERQGELIVQQLDQAGIKVNLRSVDPKTLDSLVGGWQFDLALSGHGGLGGDPAILNKVVLDQSSFNSARYDENSELNDLLESQVEEMDPARRKDLVDSAQEMLAEDLPALPLYYTDSYWASNDKVDFYFTYGGVGSGVPIALNKMIFV